MSSYEIYFTTIHEIWSSIIKDLFSYEGKRTQSIKNALKQFMHTDTENLVLSYSAPSFLSTGLADDAASLKVSLTTVNVDIKLECFTDTISGGNQFYTHYFEIEIIPHPEIATNHEFSYSDQYGTSPPLFLDINEIEHFKRDLRDKLLLPLVEIPDCLRINSFWHLKHEYGDDDSSDYFLSFHSKNFLNHINQMENDLEWLKNYCKELLLFIIRKHKYAAEKIFVSSFLNKNRYAIYYNQEYIMLLPNEEDYFRKFL